MQLTIEHALSILEAVNKHRSISGPSFMINDNLKASVWKAEIDGNNSSIMLDVTMQVNVVGDEASLCEGIIAGHANISVPLNDSASSSIEIISSSIYEVLDYNTSMKYSTLSDITQDSRVFDFVSTLYKTKSFVIEREAHKVLSEILKLKKGGE